ncbi:universal stress protein [Nocardia sp. CY41]|uniref:universal stress protein n=1 Tax=Nocardia sp. CY41 TaxID=2608686 RepID=UPI001F202759|nr:universal stress protein [Nocardia sp. CY41]
MRTVRPIVVGVDGSAASFAAVRWAAGEAARRHAPLHLVHAIGVPADAVPVLGRLLFDTSGLREVGDSALDAGRSLVQEIAGRVGAIVVETFVESSSPVPALVGRSADARLLVVGARGLGAFERVLLGSVGIGLIRHARCPVAVVPGLEESVPRLSQRPVLVGVDGSRCSDLALGMAFDEASIRQVGLIAVTIWSRRDAPSGAQERTSSPLEESLAGFTRKYPEVEVHRVLAEGSPAQRLLQESGNAQLIVLGSRGRGGVAGATLGSVSQAVLQESRIPVLIATRRQ